MAWRVLNRHSRRFQADPGEVGRLLDTLATERDGLWPLERWPPMRLDGPVAPGAEGGHGPIRYRVEKHTPGVEVLFRFSAPRGFNGTHGFAVVPREGDCEVRHTIDMRISGSALFSWPVVFRPLHDALLEDSLDKAEAALKGEEWRQRPFPAMVRFLRSLLARKGAPDVTQARKEKR